MRETVITCNFCFEQFEVSSEVGSAFNGNNTEIYDCEICCNPNIMVYVVDCENTILAVCQGRFPK